MQTVEQDVVDDLTRIAPDAMKEAEKALRVDLKNAKALLFEVQANKRRVAAEWYKVILKLRGTASLRLWQDRSQGLVVLFSQQRSDCIL